MFVRHSHRGVVDFNIVKSYGRVRTLYGSSQSLMEMLFVCLP